MDLIYIEYTGTKPYKDKRCGSFATWNPGDVKPVSAKAAHLLAKFAEFNKVDKPAPAAQPGAPADAQQAHTEQRQAAEQAAIQAVQADEAQRAEAFNEKEAMLLTVQSWGKDELLAYAEKYDAKITKSKGLNAIREEIGILIEQFGVR